MLSILKSEMQAVGFSAANVNDDDLFYILVKGSTDFDGTNWEVFSVDILKEFFLHIRGKKNLNVANVVALRKKVTSRFCYAKSLAFTCGGEDLAEVYDEASKALKEV